MPLPAQRFDVRAVDRGDAYVITPIGELDLATTAELTRALSIGRRSDAQVIVADLSRLTFIDSSGMQMLATTHRALGDRLILANATPQVRRVFELAGLTALLSMSYEPRRVTAAATRRDHATLATAIHRLRTRRRDERP